MKHENAQKFRPKFRPIFRPILRPGFRPVKKNCRRNFALGNVLLNNPLIKTTAFPRSDTWCRSANTMKSDEKRQGRETGCHEDGSNQGNSEKWSAEGAEDV